MHAICRKSTSLMHQQVLAGSRCPGLNPGRSSEPRSGWGRPRGGRGCTSRRRRRPGYPAPPVRRRLQSEAISARYRFYETPFRPKHFWTNIGQMSDKCRTNVGQMSDKCRTNVWQMSDKCRTNVGQMSDKCRTNVGQMSDKCQTNFHAQKRLTNVCLIIWDKILGLGHEKQYLQAYFRPL
jgi:hypothetical protein